MVCFVLLVSLRMNLLSKNINRIDVLFQAFLLTDFSLHFLLHTMVWCCIRHRCLGTSFFSPLVLFIFRPSISHFFFVINTWICRNSDCRYLDPSLCVGFTSWNFLIYMLIFDCSICSFNIYVSHAYSSFFPVFIQPTVFAICILGMWFFFVSISFVYLSWYSMFPVLIYHYLIDDSCFY